MRNLIRHNILIEKCNKQVATVMNEAYNKENLFLINFFREASRCVAAFAILLCFHETE